MFSSRFRGIQRPTQPSARPLSLGLVAREAMLLAASCKSPYVRTCSDKLQFTNTAHRAHALRQQLLHSGPLLSSSASPLPRRLPSSLSSSFVVGIIIFIIVLVCAIVASTITSSTGDRHLMLSVMTLIGSCLELLFSVLMHGR